jgi:hypothetical protein
MAEFTPKAVHAADPAHYYAGMIHVYAFTKGENKAKTIDEFKELECHRGAVFFFVISSFIRLFGRLPKGEKEAKAVDQFQIELGVTPRWRPSGQESSQGAAGQEPSDPSGS